jgi:hypothetical protein
MNTLFLDTATWDLCLDTSRNIAVASDPYAIAQGVANACRTFLGEVWYDTTVGIPYFTDVLGQIPPLSLIKAHLEQAAMTVDGVVEAKSIITGYSARQLSGQILFTDANGVAQGVNF